MTLRTPSAEQQQILDWVQSGSGHAVVQATAGSGGLHTNQWFWDCWKKKQGTPV